MFKKKEYTGIDFGLKELVFFSNGDNYPTLKPDYENTSPEDIVQNRVLYWRKIAKFTFSKNKYACIEDYDIDSIAKSVLPNDKNQAKRKYLDKQNRLQGFDLGKKAFQEEADRTGGKLFVLPADYSSQECSKCGYTAKVNTHRDIDRFCCLKCSHEEHIGLNASRNMQFRGMTIHIMQVMRMIDPKFDCSKDEIPMIVDALNKTVKEIKEKQSYTYKKEDPTWFKILKNSIL